MTAPEKPAEKPAAAPLDTPLANPLDNPVRHCPKCGSVRVHRSRRRGLLDQALAALGGDICRCHDCRGRQAWFGFSPIPIGNRDPDVPSWAGLAVVSSALAGLALVWWVVTRFAERSF